jgi:hypothetical protein
MLIKEHYKYDLFIFLESSFSGYWVGSVLLFLLPMKNRDPSDQV